MVSEQVARDMNDAIKAFQKKDSDALNAQNDADLVIAQTWYDTTIQPTLTWQNTQADNIQLSNTISDRTTIVSTVAANRFRRQILRLESQKLTERIRQIKGRL